jgi:hypothetical protein
MAKGQNTSSAVMAQRAPDVVEKDDALTALYRKLDFFPTPPWAARAVAETVRLLTPNARTAGDPACGMGHFGEPLRDYFDFVGMSDIHDYGRCYEARDFLDGDSLFATPRGDMQPDWVITNPPFHLALEFLQAALKVAYMGIAFVCRTNFLHSDTRYAQLYLSQAPLTLLAPFIERPNMVLGRWDPDASTATDYSAFFFVNGLDPLPIRPIPPGTKQRLTKADDARRFAASPAPLFETLEEARAP